MQHQRREAEKGNKRFHGYPMLQTQCQSLFTKPRQNCRICVKSDAGIPVCTNFRIALQTGMSASHSSMRLLIIDDDIELCQLVADYLKPMGFEVEMEHDGEHGAERATSKPWSAVILDVMIPGCDGFEVLRRIRAKSKVPVMMLTGRGEEVDRIVGLELGADDYLPKTFSSRELLARLRAVLRRTGWIAETSPQAPIKELVIGELRINPETHDVVLGDQPVQLTPAEFGLLLSLAKAHGRVKTREQLIEEVADREWDVFDRAIDMHISTLRKKLGDDPKEPRFIKTVRGYGYQLVTPGR